MLIHTLHISITKDIRFLLVFWTSSFQVKPCVFVLSEGYQSFITGHNGGVGGEQRSTLFSYVITSHFLEIFLNFPG